MDLEHPEDTAGSREQDSEVQSQDSEVRSQEKMNAPEKPKQIVSLRKKEANSRRKIEANRRNALRSTGPRSRE